MKKLNILMLFAIFFITLTGFAKTYYFYVGLASDGSVVRLNGDGDTIWEYTVPTGAINDIHVDSNQFIYASSNDEVLYKIDPYGNQVWQFTGFTDIIEDIVIDSDNNIYAVARDNTVRKIDSDGNQLDIKNLQSDGAIIILSIDIDDNGNIYAGDATGNLFKLDNNLDLVWQEQTYGNGIWAIYVKDNEIHVGDQLGNYYIIDSDGTIINDNGDIGSWIFDISSDSNGNIYLVGNDSSYTKYDSNNNQLFSENKNIGDIKNIYIDDNDFVYVATRNEIITKYSPNGAELWRITFEGQFSNGFFITRDYRYNATTTGLIYLLPTLYTITIISGGFVFAVVRKNENRMKSIIETAIFIVLGLSLLPIIIAIGQW